MDEKGTVFASAVSEGVSLEGENYSFRPYFKAVSYTHLRAHETPEHLVCRLLLEKKQKTQ